MSTRQNILAVSLMRIYLSHNTPLAQIDVDKSGFLDANELKVLKSMTSKTCMDAFRSVVF